MVANAAQPAPLSIGDRRRLPAPPVALACWAAAMLFLLALAGGAPAHLEGLDTDDYMRLQEVRDFLSGQAWADLRQHRFETPEGGSMHFSRLPDAPMAAFIAGARLFVGERNAETGLLYLWPAAMLLLYLLAANRAVRAVDPGAGVMHAIFAAATIPVLWQFKPGRIDHHSLQLFLACLALYFAVRAADKPRAAAGAGIAVVLMLTIGMETAPYAAAAAVAVALPWLMTGDGKGLRAFGAALLAGGPVALFVVRFGGDFGAVECDAYSAPQAAAAFVAGAGAYLLGRFGARLASPAARIAGAGVAGAAALAALGFSFPGCLAGPYAGLDPLVADLWLANVGEARGMIGAASAAPASAPYVYFFPFVGAGVGAYNVIRAKGAARAQHAAILLFLLAAIAVTVWQVRGAAFANAFAALPPALFLARAASGAAQRPRPLAILGALALSPLSGLMLTAAVASVAHGQLGGETGPRSARECLGPRDAFAALNREPPGLALTGINMGAQTIALTHHRATSAPYHRNAGGMKRALTFFSATPQAAAAQLAADPVDYVLICPSSREMRRLAERFPDSLAAALVAGRAPPWLEAVAFEGAPFRFYRAAPAK